MTCLHIRKKLSNRPILKNLLICMWISLGSNITRKDGLFASSFGTIPFIQYLSKNNNDNNNSSSYKIISFYVVLINKDLHHQIIQSINSRGKKNQSLYHLRGIRAVHHLFLFYFSNLWIFFFLKYTVRIMIWWRER